MRERIKITAEELLDRYAAGERNFAGIKIKRRRRTRIDLTRVNLSGIDLSGAYFSGTNFSGANLSSANFSGADLSVDFSGLT